MHAQSDLDDLFVTLSKSLPVPCTSNSSPVHARPDFVVAEKDALLNSCSFLVCRFFFKTWKNSRGGGANSVSLVQLIHVWSAVLEKQAIQKL